jgi:membrane-bound ClpP family serine protease
MATPKRFVLRRKRHALVIIASADADRGSLLGIGIVLLVFGLVWLIEPGAFQEWLGVGRDTGLLYLVLGVAAIVIGLMSRVRRVREVERY